ncbi:sulfotransferase family protein [Altererythrobacter sp. B11]|uniref:sulfotransferase family protein n=1 Tax=Altererythrobacter sp. B11 TaxID=2060312 RepID=UPI000E5A88D2|nr:sulfotransferase family protein [Altererythrobacter sp. B11]
MALDVICAGLGRTGTLSLKLALERLGFGKCHHMVEVLADVRRLAPLWEQAAAGQPDWDAIFAGFASTTDYPACRFWEQLAQYYPQAKIVLSVRDPDSWFDSVSKTIFAPPHMAFFGQTAIGGVMRDTVYDTFGDRIGDRQFMTDWFRAWNSAVIERAPADRLLIYEVKQGWEPLCEFLGVPVPAEPFPRVNSSEDMQEGLDFAEPPPPEGLEAMGKGYLAQLRAG